MKPRAEIGNESNANAVVSSNAASKDVDHTSQEPKYLNDQVCLMYERFICLLLYLHVHVQCIRNLTSIL